MSYLDLYIDNNLFMDLDFNEFLNFVRTGKLEIDDINKHPNIGSFYIES